MKQHETIHGSRLKKCSQSTLFILGLFANAVSICWADWSAKTMGTMFFTDDVGIFSATRRLNRDNDPTQPALDSSLTGQGSDFVFEPQVEAIKSLNDSFGKTDISLQGSGFIYFNNTRYNHGNLRVQAEQAFNTKTTLLLRYYYAPNLFLGDNEERQTGMAQTVGETVTSNIWSTRLSQKLTDKVEVRLLGRFGLRRYNQAYDERNTDFWTIGPHVEWQFLPEAKVALSYHFERGLADGRKEPQFEDDISYINHYASVDLDYEISERFSFYSAFHFERNNWTSNLQGDERNGAFETVYQGEAILFYQINQTIKAYTGIQYSSRIESFEQDAAKNLNIGLGLTANFE